MERNCCANTEEFVVKAVAVLRLSAGKMEREGKEEKKCFLKY